MTVGTVGITGGKPGSWWSMTKDRDQLTPAEADDRDKIQPRRSSDREASRPDDPSTGPGPASAGADPRAADEVGGEEGRNYR